jgi:predicted DNA-binding protein
MRSATKNFHLPLPERAYEELRREAAREGRPATTVAREAIEEWLERRRKSELHEQIAEYASAQKGSAADLDPALERAAVGYLRKIKS